jgi:hypothetical protein
MAYLDQNCSLIKANLLAIFYRPKIRPKMANFWANLFLQKIAFHF